MRRSGTISLCAKQIYAYSVLLSWAPSVLAKKIGLVVYVTVVLVSLHAVGIEDVPVVWLEHDDAT